ncbi:unnamed protein product [Paramecium pentaurelia]|uniref:Dynein regulatory complex protein 10 n=1 Tax=Paramecium pentaurelia TaxID=43138 RepID=A0A8S1SV02_9CILI|nr:unnamed protein product [Paramecium pentaurelia]CAD8143119.1 unnamed protein product [Paramecium pentaurelia]
MKGAHKQFAKTMETSLGENRVKQQQRSLQEGHQEIIKNLMSTIIGKPTIVEAQRVLRVLDQLIQNLEYCLYLDTEFIGRFQTGKFLKDAKQPLTEETMKLLQSQAEIEQKYRPYANLDTALNQGEEIDETKKMESERLENLLQENFKNLLRRLQHCPKDYDIIKGMKTNINTEMSDLLHCVKCIKIVMLKKLSTAQEEQNSHVKQLEDLKSKIAGQEKTKSQLEQELQKIRQERTANMNKMKEEIEKLKQSIAEVKANKQKRQDQLAKEIQTKYEGLEKDHKTKEDKLQAELQAQRARFIKMKDENTQEEATLKRRKQVQDQSLSEAIQIYDQMMEEYMKNLTDLQSECASIEKQLKDRQEYFKAVDSEKGRERQLEEEFRRLKELHQIELEKKSEAAKHIQAFLQQVKKPSKKPKKAPKK